MIDTHSLKLTAKAPEKMVAKEKDPAFFLGKKHIFMGKPLVSGRAFFPRLSGKLLRPDPEASLAPVPQVPMKSWCASEGEIFWLVHFVFWAGAVFFFVGFFFCPIFVGTKICKKMDLYEN